METKGSRRAAPKKTMVSLRTPGQPTRFSLLADAANLMSRLEEHPEWGDRPFTFSYLTHDGHYWPESSRKNVGPDSELARKIKEGDKNQNLRASWRTDVITFLKEARRYLIVKGDFDVLQRFERHALCGPWETSTDLIDLKMAELLPQGPCSEVISRKDCLADLQSIRDLLRTVKRSTPRVRVAAYRRRIKGLFGKALYDARMASPRQTQKEAAAAIGVPQPRYSEIERGKTPPEALTPEIYSGCVRYIEKRTGRPFQAGG